MFEEYFLEHKGFRTYKEEGIGFVLFKIVEDELYIRDIYVKPEMRRQRWAFKLADKVVEYAKSQGCKMLVGEVEPSASNSTESVKLLTAYGMRLFSSSDDEVWFAKEI